MKSTFLFGLLLASACSGNSSSGVSYDEAIPVTSMAAPDGKSADDIRFGEQDSDESTNVQRQVIKQGDISFQSKNVAADYEQVKKLVASFRAQIEHENQSKEYDRMTYHLTIRVPSKHYDSLLNTLASIAWRLDNKSSNAEDVTEQYYDLETRIKNKKALEARYLELLKQTKTMRDILEIENSLNNVRSEIESMEGRFRYLKNQISMSTIRVQMYEMLPAAEYQSPRKSFIERLTEGMGKGWNGFLSFMVVVVSLWPFWILFGLVVWGIRAWRKRRKS